MTLFVAGSILFSAITCVLFAYVLYRGLAMRRSGCFVEAHEILERLLLVLASASLIISAVGLLLEQCGIDEWTNVLIFGNSALRSALFIGAVVLVWDLVRPADQHR